jgi:hypothetical protein
MRNIAKKNDLMVLLLEATLIFQRSWKSRNYNKRREVLETSILKGNLIFSEKKSS